jgi:predicted MPP superfamily phosphohydrolase
MEARKLMAERKWTRRAFLRRGAGVILAAGAATGLYAWRVEPHWVEVVRRELPIAHLPPDLEGRTLVQLSDLHIGDDVEDDYLRAGFQLAGALEPDILAVTGDFMTCRSTEQLDHAGRVLEHLPHGRLATLAILGNHDHGHLDKRDRLSEKLTDLLGGLGVTVLRNQSTRVRGLTVTGLDDLWGPAFAPRLVMPGLKGDEANLVLCHNPDAADLPVWSGYRGWILSGHTHGGQCRIPGYGAPLLPVQNKRYVAGEVDAGEGRRLYINRGLGHLVRVRFLVRPEITMFTLRREEPTAG